MKYVDILIYSCVIIPVFLFIYTIKWKKDVINKIGSPLVIRSLISLYSPHRFLIKFLFIFLGLCLLAYVLVNFGKLQVGTDVMTEGTNIIVAIDVSNSMLCTDVKPSRFEKAKSLAGRLIEQGSNYSFGVIAFAGKAILEMPLTTDTAEAKSIVKDMGVDYFPVSGTSLKSVLQLGDVSLSIPEKKQKVIILISDGEDHDSAAVQAAKVLVSHGVIVYAIGVGTKEGGSITFGNTTNQLKDVNGNLIITKLNESLLKNVAEAANGQYYLLENQNVVVNNIYQDISRRGSAFKNENQKANRQNIYLCLLNVALMLLVAEVFISEIKNKA